MFGSGYTPVTILMVLGLQKHLYACKMGYKKEKMSESSSKPDQVPVNVVNLIYIYLKINHRHKKKKKKLDVGSITNNVCCRQYILKLFFKPAFLQYAEHIVFYTCCCYLCNTKIHWE